MINLSAGDVLKKDSVKYIVIIFLLFFAGCAYYNTFFNAKERYNEAFKKQQSTKSLKISGDVKKGYTAAIAKSWKLIDVYGDSSEYADDALLLIGKAYYHLTDYPKAQRVLEQFIPKYNRSELLADAKLYLARTHIALKNDDQALKILDKIFESKVSTDIAGEAFYILGDLYYQKGEYEKAAENLNKCIDIISDEAMFANAHFLLGETYFAQGEYDNAILHYDKLMGLDIPALREYEALIKKADAMIAQKKYESAEVELKKVLRYQRFKEQLPLIETKLGQLYQEQGDVRFAADHFYEVIRKYKKAEGSKLSSFYLAQLYEYQFFDFDSAKAYYDRVKGLNNYPGIEAESRERSDILREYLKIRNQLRKDRRDLLRLAKGDSTFTDSVDVEADSVALAPDEKIQTDALKDDNFREPFSEHRAANPDSIKADSLKKVKKRQKKIAVSRSAEQVQQSYLRNSFALGEFFLLKYEDYDSAWAVYDNFTREFSDSALTPKAYYSLYYLAKDIFLDSTAADSLKEIILQKHPESAYAHTILNKKIETKTDQKELRADLYKPSFLKAEDLRESGDFEQAIQIFRNIAAKDSGSVWAQKSRYNIAYIYEKNLKKIAQALEAYKIILREYPASAYAKIAKNKTMEPPKETASQDKEKKPEISPKKPKKRSLEEEDDVLPPKKPVKNDQEKRIKK